MSGPNLLFAQWGCSTLSPSCRFLWSLFRKFDLRTTNWQASAGGWGRERTDRQTNMEGREGQRADSAGSVFFIQLNRISILNWFQNFRIAAGGGDDDDETTLAFTCVFKLSYMQKEYSCQLQASAPAVDKTFSRNKLWMHIRKIANKKAAGRLCVCKILCDLPIKAYSGRVLSQKNKQTNTEANRRRIFCYFLNIVLLNLDFVQTLRLILTSKSRD